MRVPVRKFREAALWQIHGDDLPPGWNRGCAAFDYMFYKQARQLKIETPGFSKINVYCGENAEAYNGDVWDGCVTVQVRVDSKELAKVAYNDVPYVAFDLMMTGVKTVFDYFDLEWERVQAIADRLKQERFSYSEDLGTRVEKNATRTLGARLRCTTEAPLEHCVIVADIYRKSKKIDTVPICTIFPWPEIAKEDFIELRWVDEAKFVVKFIHGIGAGREQYGRRHLDASGFDRVSEHHVFTTASSKPITSELHVDLTGLDDCAA